MQNGPLRYRLCITAMYDPCIKLIQRYAFQKYPKNNMKSKILKWFKAGRVSLNKNELINSTYAVVKSSFINSYTLIVCEKNSFWIALDI